MMFTGGSQYKKRNNNNHEARGRRHERHARHADRVEINKVLIVRFKTKITYSSFQMKFPEF